MSAALISKPRRISGNLRLLVRTAVWAFTIAWRAHPLIILGLALAALVSSLVPAASALVIRELINAAMHALEVKATSLATIAPWLVAGLILTVVEVLSTVSNRYLMLRLKDDLDLTITTTILRHASTLDLGCFEDVEVQDVLDRSRENTADHFTMLLSGGMRSVGNILQAVSLTVVLAAIDPLAVIILTPLSVPHFIFQWRLSRRRYVEVHNRATKRRWGRYFISLLTDRHSVPEVKLLQLGPVLIEKFRTLTKIFRDQNRKRYRDVFIADATFTIIATTAFYLLFARIFLKFLQGSVLIGDVVIFGPVGLRLRSALHRMVGSVSSCMEHALYISDVRKFLDVEPRVKVTGTLKPHAVEGRIEFSDVSFSYPGTKTPALSNISFRIDPGEAVALVGRNGAGKTTLVRLMARFYDPDKGKVLLDDIALPDIDIEFLHRLIAFVPQNFGQYEATVSDNIAYGAWERLLDDEVEVQRIAASVGVDELIEGMPQSYNTLLGRTFGEHDLSIGQWQQIAIARAFARNGVVMILDEPTSNLDAMAEYEIFRRFRNLAHGRTTILVSHRFSTVRMADRIIVLERGRMVEIGTHDELIDRKGHYADLYNMHQRQLNSRDSSGSQVVGSRRYR